MCDRHQIKEAIDRELCQITLGRCAAGHSVLHMPAGEEDGLSQTTGRGSFQSAGHGPFQTTGHGRRRRPAASWRAAALLLAFLAFSGMSAAAVYFVHSHFQVNGEVLPDIDPLSVTEMTALDAQPDEYGLFQEEYPSYEAAAKALGLPLLDASLPERTAQNPYMHVQAETDNQDYAQITVHNYLVGDCTEFQLLEDGLYHHTGHGQAYYSPVSLTVTVILSEEQLAIGWNHDYLGAYTFAESYTSPQGYRVNLIEDTTGENAALPDGIVSEKCAVFAADGILYTLTGRVSTETMKEIVASMQ